MDMMSEEIARLYAAIPDSIYRKKAAPKAKSAQKKSAVKTRDVKEKPKKNTKPTIKTNVKQSVLPYE